MSKDKVDMSLDDIIKLNKRTVKSEPKSPRGSSAIRGQTRSATRGGSTRGARTRSAAGRGRGAPTRGRGTAARGGQQTARKTNNSTYRVPNKLRKYAAGTPQTNTRVTGAKGQAAQRRKLINQGRQQIVNKARQTLTTKVLRQQKARKQAILNKYRGINTNQPTTSTGRRKLVRPGLGVMQADIESRQLKQKQVAAVQQAAAVAAQERQEQSNRNKKRRWTNSLQRREQRAQTSAAAGRLPAVKNEPGHVLTIRVKNEPSTSQQSRPAQAQARRSQAVANRMLRNTLQQPMRERRQQSQQAAVSTRGARGPRGRRALGSGIGGQVRMLSNTIEKLQAQVASLQRGGVSRGVSRGGRHGGSRGGTRGRGGRGAPRNQSGGGFNNQASGRGRRGRRAGRQNNTSAALPGRKVLW